MELQVPRLRTLPFETQIIERYKTKQSSVEEALIEMYLARVSVRHMEDITEALWGRKSRFQPGKRIKSKDIREDRRMAHATDSWRASIHFRG